MYWIQERHRIQTKKILDYPKPWSEDPVFQETYFCNVHREDDKITRFIRSTYSPYVDHPMFEYNIVLSRFLNWPYTLAAIGFQRDHDPKGLLAHLDALAKDGVSNVWGNAYVITTHGQKMPKAAYLCNQVLSDVWEALPSLRPMCRAPLLGHWPTCSGASVALQRIDGIGSFLAGQIVADLKNTKLHPLYTATDKATFFEVGPGSIKGLGWFLAGNEKGCLPSQFNRMFGQVREYVDANWPEQVPRVDNQDLQNCLCEYDKYCRVVTATGRSKRNYNGT